jgi:hypothetical protein
MKIHPVGTELLHVDGHTHTHSLTYIAKLMGTFRSFPNSLENFTMQFTPFVSQKFGYWLGNKGIWVLFPPGARYFSCFLLRLDEFWDSPSFLPFD